jgi:glycine/D-amino acid oxidase-like deaminating enzyme
MRLIAVARSAPLAFRDDAKTPAVSVNRRHQEKDPEEVFRRLEKRLRRTFPTATLEKRWMGQVIETEDGMPYIVENSERQFIVTGFSVME